MRNIAVHGDTERKQFSTTFLTATSHIYKRYSTSNLYLWRERPKFLSESVQLIRTKNQPINWQKPGFLISSGPFLEQISCTSIHHFVCVKYTISAFSVFGFSLPCIVSPRWRLGEIDFCCFVCLLFPSPRKTFSPFSRLVFYVCDACDLGESITLTAFYCSQLPSRAMRIAWNPIATLIFFIINSKQVEWGREARHEFAFPPKRTLNAKLV